MKSGKAGRIIYLLFLLLASTVINRAQCVPDSTVAGAVDTCFGTGGKVTTDITADRDYSRALALQTDGKIVVAGISGYSATAGNADFTVVRYNTDGSLDTTFDGDGIVITDVGIGVVDDDYCRGLGIQPDGKIVIAGRAIVSPTTYGLVVIRYNTNGSLDTTFDGDGKAWLEMAEIVDMYSFALQPDGKILAGGRSYLNGFNGLIARFNSNGSVDTSFGTNGRTSASLKGVFSLALQSDGKIIAGGSSGPDPTLPAFAIARLNSDGSLDSSFGTSGVATYHPTFADQTWFVKVRFDNEIFFGGHSAVTQGDPRASLFHFSSGGALVQGMIYPEQNAYWNGTFQTDGKPLIVGASFVPSSGFTIRRFIDANTPDTTFNGGVATVKFLPAGIPEASGINAIAMTRDNKIVAAGSVTEQDNQTTGWRWAVTRLYSGLLPPHPERFDFDGDGKADPSIFRPSNGQWWYLKSSDGGNAAFQFGAGTDLPAPGDYTGDGKTDIGFWRPSTGEWFILRSEDFSYYAFPFGTNGDIPRPSDFDGDGKTDYIVYRPSQTTWYRINSIGIPSFQQIGIAGDKPLIGDFDGDGKSDPAVFRPSNGTWWWLSSVDNAQHAVQWGIATDTLAPGDYDGDGKTDFAVYRSSTGTWYIYNTSNGSITVTTFGISEDKPAPADFDGDGKADIALFRPSSGVWYVLRSTAGFEAVGFGLSGDIPTPSAFAP